MEPLQKEFYYRGFKYEQVKRTDNTAIYAQYFVEDDGGLSLLTYEVFHIRKQKESYNEKTGIHFKAKELPPSDESFGYYAFACKNLKHAELRFKELEERFTNSSDEQVIKAMEEVEEDIIE